MSLWNDLSLILDFRFRMIFFVFMNRKTSFFRKFHIQYIILFTILCFTALCTNPIEKKKKQLENCKITLDSVKIAKYRMLLIPPVPKIYFKAKVNVENANTETVTLQKFDFKVMTNRKSQNNSTIAEVQSTEEHELQAGEIKALELNLVTMLEETADEEIVGLVIKIFKSLIMNEELEFLLKGNVHFDTAVGKLSIPVEQVFKTKARL